MILIDSHISGSKVKVIPLVLTLRVVCSLSNEPFTCWLPTRRLYGKLKKYGPPCNFYNDGNDTRAKCFYNICSEIKCKIGTSFIPVTHIFLVYSLTDWARRKAI